jgi:hypothetical protein
MEAVRILVVGTGGIVNERGVVAAALILGERIPDVTSYGGRFRRLQVKRFVAKGGDTLQVTKPQLFGRHVDQECQTKDRHA